VDAKSKPRDTRQFIEEVLRYRGQLDLLEQFQQWEAPRFPVNGHHLKEAGCAQGRLMSLVMDKLRDEWKRADFDIELDKLLDKIPEVMDGVDVAQFETKKKKRKKSLDSV